MSSLGVCSDPFKKHKTPKKVTEKNRSNFRFVTEKQSVSCSVELPLKSLLCNSCRYDVDKDIQPKIQPTVKKKQDVPSELKSKSIVCSNPFKSHGEKRKDSLKRFFKVQEKLSDDFTKAGIPILTGDLLCNSCKTEALRRLAPPENNKRTFCADPCSRHSKPLKNKILYMFANPDDHHLTFCDKLNLKLDQSDFVCAGCRHYMDKRILSSESSPSTQTFEGQMESDHYVPLDDFEIEEMQIDNDQMEVTSSSSSSIGSSFYDSDREVEDINILLNQLQIGKINKSIRNSQKEMKLIYKNSKLKLASILSNFSKFDIDFEGTSLCKCKTCAICMPRLLTRFKQAETRREMYLVLTCTPLEMSISELQDIFKISQRMAENVSKLRKDIGPCSSLGTRTGNMLCPSTVEKVITFYLDPNNSKIMPGQRDTVILRTIENGKIVKTATSKHQMMTTLNDVYTEFINLNKDIKISKTKFAKLKPRQCIWGFHKGFSRSCLCIHHCNFKLLVEGINITGKTDEILLHFFCELSENCMMGLCNVCPKFEHALQNLDLVDSEEIEFMEWANDSGRTLELISRRLSKDKYIEKLKVSLLATGSHHFIHLRQRDHIAYLKLNFVQQPGCAVLNVDFGENYSFVVKDAVQGFHWSNIQATIHPFVLHYFCQETKQHKTFCIVVISNCLSHDATTFHIFRLKVLAEIKKKFAWITYINYVSDGAPSQYKCAKNFSNLANHFADFGIQARWTYFATCHGKDLCDAYSGISKRETRLESLRRSADPILNAKSMFTFLHGKKTTDILKYLYVDNQDVEEFIESGVLATRYLNFKSTPGTRKFHDVECTSTGLKFRKTSVSTEFYEYKNTDEISITVENEREKLLKNLKSGDWIALLYSSSKTLLMGCIDKINLECSEVKVTMMQKAEKGESNYKWFNPQKCDWIYIADVVDKIEPPAMKTMRMYSVSSIDMARVKEKAISLIQEFQRQK